MRRIHFDATDSTNLQARALAEAHPGEPLLVTAAVQTAGRGRQGRCWQSPLGGAWLSVVWPGPRTAGAATAGIALAAAVAARRAVCRVAHETAPRLRIKWPNDLLLDDCKIAGILCEHAPLAGAGAGGVLIVGVGVNVDFDSELFPPELRHPATTLRAALGRSLAVDEVVAAVADSLEIVLTAYGATGLDDALRTELTDHLAYLGEVRTWHSPAGPVAGRVLGIDSAGRLLLDGPGGVIACDTGELSAPGSARG
jgi:BirA family biotin operon repressor/biotin-[acetyl-CoA-carboxylase] ligase